MAEAVSAVAQAPLPKFDAPDVTSGGAESQPRPQPEISAPQAARFDDVVRALRMQEVFAPPVPKGREAWTRMGRHIHGGLDRIAGMEAKIIDSTREFLRPPAPTDSYDLAGSHLPVGNVASVDPSAPVALAPLSAVSSNGVPSNGVSQLVEAMRELTAAQKENARTTMKHALETSDFVLSMTMLMTTTTDLQKTINSLSQGG